MTTSKIEEAAMRLLRAFRKLSGGKPNEVVPLGRVDTPPTEGAAKAAAMDLGSTEVDVSVRYLLDQGYIQGTAQPNAYRITVAGIEKVTEAGDA